ncbi:MAG TPA: transposase [Acidobacteriota bacterium]|nr:transposase [Acidobacteriota bacterium]
MTFCTRNRWHLPESVRQRVLEHCLHDHGCKIHLHCAVVMPDHVHLVYHPLPDDRGSLYPLEEILGGLKGASAHSVNRMLKRKGAVWQEESYDHVLRSTESLHEAVLYVCHNPVRRGLCSQPEDYPWLWVDFGE